MHQKVQHEPTILRRRHVEQRTGLSRSTLYQYQAQPPLRFRQWILFNLGPDGSGIR